MSIDGQRSGLEQSTPLRIGDLADKDRSKDEHRVMVWLIERTAQVGTWTIIMVPAISHLT